MEELKNFQKKIGVTFKNEDLLREAFTHRSYINENRKPGMHHNERLEFLGDAVLELATTDFLYKKYPEKTEGDLTSYRAGLVNTSTLSTVATGLEINDHLFLSKGEARDTGRARHYILANTLEALIGAIHLDQGYEAARGFIEANILPLTDDIVDNQLWLDSKSRFQETAQEKLALTPTYNVLREEGPDHSRNFVVGAFLGDKKVAEGTGHSKQEAEQEAAEKAFEAQGWESKK